MVKKFEESLNFYTDIVGLNVDRSLNPAPGVQIAFLGIEDSIYWKY